MTLNVLRSPETCMQFALDHLRHQPALIPLVGKQKENTTCLGSFWGPKQCFQGSPQATCVLIG
jgi:hypothetical protein